MTTPPADPPTPTPTAAVPGGSPPGRDRPSHRWQTVLARVRLPLLIGGAVLLVFGPLDLPRYVKLAGLAALYLVVLRAGTVRQPPITVEAPVRGRWQALNSPATRVPSHGIQAYGQSHAIDLVHEPPGRGRPGLRLWPLARRPADFPAFGQPIYAAAGGVVVRAHAWERDHWSRTSPLGLLYVVVEGLVRELTGPSRILGNHLVIRHDDGSYATYAHLGRRSLRVARGERVRPGQHIADCGNSGNSTEPHLHFQLMDHRSVVVAAGLPVSFRAYESGGVSRSGMPANGETFEVAAPG